MFEGINQLTSRRIIEPEIIAFVSKIAFLEEENWKRFNGEKILVMESLKYE